ncbi:MAG: DUF2892 domain-containing protein [Thermodesulfovibrionales bacterium]|nr:DUF2892 domain-containing protein [Thermodesulfovibrionales bacterium]
MKVNMADWDRITRIILGFLFITIAIIKGSLWWILGALGIIFIATSIVGFCPLYAILGFKTKHE